MRPKKFPQNPAHPERTCWGCDRYCAADAMACGNGSDRTPHPSELFGPDWDQWEGGRPPEAAPAEPEDVLATAVDNGGSDPCLPSAHAT